MILNNDVAATIASEVILRAIEDYQNNIDFSQIKLWFYSEDYEYWADIAGLKLSGREVLRQLNKSKTY